MSRPVDPNNPPPPVVAAMVMAGLMVAVALGFFVYVRNVQEPGPGGLLVYRPREDLADSLPGFAPEQAAGFTAVNLVRNRDGAFGFRLLRWAEAWGMAPGPLSERILPLWDGRAMFSWWNPTAATGPEWIAVLCLVDAPQCDKELTTHLADYGIAAYGNCRTFAPPDTDRPAFGIVYRYLIVGPSLAHVRRAVDSYRRLRPSIMDSNRYSMVRNAISESELMFCYFDMAAHQTTVPLHPVLDGADVAGFGLERWRGGARGSVLINWRTDPPPAWLKARPSGSVNGFSRLEATPTVAISMTQQIWKLMAPEADTSPLLRMLSSVGPAELTAAWSPTPETMAAPLLVMLQNHQRRTCYRHLGEIGQAAARMWKLKGKPPMTLSDIGPRLPVCPLAGPYPTMVVVGESTVSIQCRRHPLHKVTVGGPQPGYAMHPAEEPPPEPLPQDLSLRPSHVRVRLVKAPPPAEGLRAPVPGMDGWSWTVTDDSVLLGPEESLKTASPADGLDNHGWYHAISDLESRPQFGAHVNLAAVAEALLRAAPQESSLVDLTDVVDDLGRFWIALARSRQGFSGRIVVRPH